jgi:copper ion binding protein
MTTNATGPDDGRSRTVRLGVPGMDCPSCAEKIVNSVSALDGVVAVDPQVMTGTVRVEYRPDAVAADAVVDRVRAAGYDVESRDDLRTERFDVPAMDCPSCAGKIENALDGVAGIRERETLPTTGTVVVTYDPGLASRADLVAAIERAGYAVEELGLPLDALRVASDGGVAVEGPGGQDADDNDGAGGVAIEALQGDGKTVVLVGRLGDGPTAGRTRSGETGARVVGVVAVADEVRPEAKRTVERLNGLGVERVVMLTGDNEVTARAVGAAAGVDELRAELLPEGKAETVAALDAEFGGVMMVGDGVNDAPALATATVGVAMGAAGTDTAVESADVALMADDLSTLPYLYALSGKANSVIRENIWASIGVKALPALGVPFGLVNVAVAVVVGDMGMSLGMTTNALRLAGIEPDRLE